MNLKVLIHLHSFSFPAFVLLYALSFSGRKLIFFISMTTFIIFFCSKRKTSVFKVVPMFSIPYLSAFHLLIFFFIYKYFYMKYIYSKGALIWKIWFFVKMLAGYLKVIWCHLVLFKSFLLYFKCNVKVTCLPHKPTCKKQLFSLRTLYIPINAQIKNLKN